MMRLNIDAIKQERSEIDNLYRELYMALSKAGLIPEEVDEPITIVILDKYYYDVEKWMNEFYRVAGYLYMTDPVKTDNVCRSILRAVRLDYTVREFLYDLVSEWPSYQKINTPYSIVDININV